MRKHRRPKVERIGICLPPVLLRRLDRAVDAGDAASRSEIIRRGALLWLKHLETANGDGGAASD